MVPQLHRLAPQGFVEDDSRIPRLPLKEGRMVQ